MHVVTIAIKHITYKYDTQLVLYNSFPRGSGNIWLKNVSCSSRDSTLTECGHYGFGVKNTNCRHFNDVAMSCLDGKITIRM